MDILEVLQRQRTAGAYRQLAKVMTELGWAAFASEISTAVVLKNSAAGSCATLAPFTEDQSSR
jgi:hypothetical protein